MFVVLGVSGKTGSVVAHTLLAQGKKTRVVVRDVAKGASWKARGAEVAIADVSDAPALGRAFAGAEAAYVLVPPRPPSSQGMAADRQVVDTLVSAVDQSGVGHVVLLSSIGAQHVRGTGPIRGLHDAEQKLGASRAALTAIRAGYFMENWAGSLGALAEGVLHTFMKVSLSYPMVATRDIGTTAAAALVEGGRGKQIIELFGPREYSPADVASALASVVGKPVVPREAPEEGIVPAFIRFGFSPEMAELYREMIYGMNDGTVAFEGGSARAARGTTPIEEVLRGLLAR